MATTKATPEAAQETQAKSFNARFLDALKEMENPRKSNTAKVPTKNGGQYSYKYEDLAEVIDIVQGALNKHGLAFTQGSKWSEAHGSYVLETILFDETEQRVMDIRPLRDSTDAQQVGSWETYMRRYALRTVFGLAGEDDDGAATVGTQQAARNAANAQEGTRGRGNNYQAANGRQNAPNAKNNSTGTDQKRAAYLQRIADLRAESEAMGIRRESIDEYIAATFKGVPLEELDFQQLAVLGKHLSQVIADKKQLEQEKLDGQIL